ncbi:MAG: YbjN domain-containing protein, partial [Candidatus Rokuibacteriota bacterium]
DGATLEKANEFNRRFIFGNVVVDADNDPWLRMTHNVADGVTFGNLEYTINRFAQAIETFTEHFNFKR